MGLVFLGHLMEENVLLLLFGTVTLLVGLIRPTLVLKSSLDMLINKFVDVCVFPFPRFVGVKERFERSCPPGTTENPRLALLERIKIRAIACRV
jgi:hypothetical protein